MIDGETGYLCEPAKHDFSRSMANFVLGDESEKMGKKGRNRVERHFSFKAFTEKLNHLIEGLVVANQENTSNSKNN